MARWPNVPDVYGWLSLDARGRWLLRGEPIGNQALRQFISRNYHAAGDGCYAFQNGPQRVFVALEYTPYVIHVDADGTWRFHTGEAVRSVDQAWVDEHGALVVRADGRAALLDDRDLERVADGWVDEQGRALDDEQRAERLEQLLAGGTAGLAVPWGEAAVPIGTASRAELVARLGFEPAPRSGDDAADDRAE